MSNPNYRRKAAIEYAEAFAEEIKDAASARFMESLEAHFKDNSTLDEETIMDWVMEAYRAEV